MEKREEKTSEVEGNRSRQEEVRRDGEGEDMRRKKQGKKRSQNRKSRTETKFVLMKLAYCDAVAFFISYDAG